MERSGLYSLLAAVFRCELTEDLLGSLLDTGFLQSLAAVGVNVDGFSHLERNQSSLNQLSLEYSRLFTGPGRHVSPYESVLLGGGGGSLWGPETIAVKKFILKSGFSYDEKYHGLPDHISVEIEFMAHLTGLEARAWECGNCEKAANCLRLQKEFLDQHLGRWLDPFSEKVQQLAQLPFYSEMAKLARDFVATDRMELDWISDPETLVH